LYFSSFCCCCGLFIDEVFVFFYFTSMPGTHSTGLFLLGNPVHSHGSLFHDDSSRLLLIVNRHSTAVSVFTSLERSHRSSSSFVNTLLYRRCRRPLLWQLVSILSTPIASLSLDPTYGFQSTHDFFFLVNSHRSNRRPLLRFHRVDTTRSIGTQPIPSLSPSASIRRTRLLLSSERTHVHFVFIGMQPIPSQARSQNLESSPCGRFDPSTLLSAHSRPSLVDRSPSIVDPLTTNPPWSPDNFYIMLDEEIYLLVNRSVI